ncbi:hypothetical protein EBL_c07200 [Shimwellia blattae DSM 4481 = NBRC 105725]|uniref:Uncharacterized protein n=1 Tax=Shimwellia blattae (strain ATCC 29907 / DSM 4481 / JCM 1650 / NBRC 105725 / CDC 9005-74) TaxID=630626 RepID=I2B5N9_SHIBC|nr:hypothetical protein EBL_c07200 [Shimwellia blattae DSM 4481 = NBRC 105725]
MKYCIQILIARVYFCHTNKVMTVFECPAIRSRNQVRGAALHEHTDNKTFLPY